MRRWLATGGLFAFAPLFLGASGSVTGENCIRGAVYDDAVLHAGATDYVFVVSDGVSLTVRVTNDVSTEMGADALLTTGDDGPAEANAARLGQPHDLCQENGLIRISPSTG